MALRLGSLCLTLGRSEGYGQGHAHFNRISHKRWPIGQTLILPTQRIACGLSTGNLHLTLGYSKGKCQGRAHFDCEYLANGYSWSKHCNC